MGKLSDNTSVEGGDPLFPVDPTVTQNMPTSKDIEDDPENYYYEDEPVKNTSDSYMDIGLDINVSSRGKVAGKTAFKTTVDGIAAMGYGSTRVPYDDIKDFQSKSGISGSGSGQDYENVSNNIYDMMTQMQDAINGIKDDNSNIDEAIDKISAIMLNFQKQTDKIISAESELGVRSKFLETNLDRLENENTSLKKMQKDLEGVDDATEITNYMSYQNAWNLVLQFGKNIVPKSLMDYVN
jgi:flagellin-like hook-associated protein FlgL